MKEQELEKLFLELQKLSGAEKHVTLNQMGELIGARQITSQQIESLIVGLEQQGITVGGDSDVDMAALLRVVIQCALKLRKAGQVASAQSISQASGLSEQTVKVALLYSEVLRG